jgi:hypothetical protein
VAADQDVQAHGGTGLAGGEPELWHERQSFVPEGDHGGLIHEAGRDIGGAGQGPARGAQGDGEVLPQ